MSAHRALLADAGWLVADRAVRLGGGLIVGVWVARALGPAEFGLLSYAVAFAGLFATLATLGLDGIVVRDLVAGPVPAAVMLGTAFRLRVAGGALALLLATLAAAWTGGVPGTVPLVAVAAAVFLAQSPFVIDWRCQAAGRNRSSVLAQNAAFLAAAALKVAMILARAPLIGFALCALIEAVVAGALLLLADRHAGDGTRWRYDGTVARRLVGESWPLILSGLAFTLYVRIDQVMIGRMLGPAEVGRYAAAIRLGETWNLVPTIVVTAAFPRLLALRTADPAAYAAGTQRLFSLLAAVAIAGALATQCLGGWLILQLYGPAYAAAAPILQISVWSAIFASLGYAGGRWLIAEGQAHYALVRNLVGVGANVLLNLLLIPRLGAKGAAIATLVSYVAANLLSYVASRRLHPLLWINLRALLLIGLLPRRVGVAA